ncbi:hypothetical protein BD777DRAFT_132756 [Yarrowia lipolytica]|nr:hypothetical protein BD777DRAFT_132756 [Yarrowia lipolytica]
MNLYLSCASGHSLTSTMKQLEFSFVAELENQHISLHASTDGAMTSKDSQSTLELLLSRWFATTGEIPSTNNTLGSALLVLSQGSIPEVAERKLQSLCYDSTVETD